MNAVASEPRRLHETLCVLDAPDVVTPDEARRALGISHVSRRLTEPLRAFADALRSRPDLRCALCADPSCEGHVVRLHVRADAPVEARLHVEDLARAANLLVYDPEGSEVVRVVRLGHLRLVERALRALVGGVEGYVLLESEEDPALYVQVLSGPDAVVAEAVSTHYLPPGRALDRAQVARLRLLGWRAPEGDRRNHHRPVALRDPADARALAALFVRTLSEAYGLREGAPLVLHTFCLVPGPAATVDDGAREQPLSAHDPERSC
jgi:hypothetical protein